MQRARCGWVGFATRVASTASLAVAAATASSWPAGADGSAGPTADRIQWPDGTVALPFENLEGVILVRATVYGSSSPGLDGPNAGSSAPRALAGRDTTGWFAIDTGAGFLALDSQLALDLGVLDRLPPRSIDIAARPLPRLVVGDLTVDQVAPILIFESRLLSRVTDRPVLGLIGYGLIRDRALWIDYREQQLALVPSGAAADRDDPTAVGASRRLLSGTLSGAAVPVRFRMTEDGKVLLRVRVTPTHGGGTTPWLNLALDTGASKCTLFEDVVEPVANSAGWRPEIHGLAAPTLLAASPARLCRVKRVEVRGVAGTAEAAQVEVALIRNPLAQELETLAGEPVHGLLGYSFLKRFRVACDYPRRVLWLDPIRAFHDGDADQHAQVGLQFERSQGGVHIVAVIDGSPAARAGIQPGDELVSVDGQAVSGVGAAQLGRRLEGVPGSTVTLTTRRGKLEQTHHLRRRRLL